MDEHRDMIEVVKLVEQSVVVILTDEQSKVFGEYKNLLQTDRELFDAIYLQALDELEA